MRLPLWIRRHLAAVRALLVLTVVLGVFYPLAVWAVAQVPGLRDSAEGSTIKGPGGGTVGSSLIGQSFTDKEGNPLQQYFQSRPSATIDSAVKGQEAANPDDPSYNPTGSAAGNLGPEDIVDTLPDPAVIKAGKDDENARTSLLTTVCQRSLAVGALEGVDGSRPYCTKDGVGAVLSLIGPREADGHVAHPTRVVSVNQECSDDPAKPVTPFIATYRGVTVECARYGEDYKVGEIVPIKGSAPADPKVPADAVTASGSGLDPDISPAYARLQAPRIARTRGVTEAQVLQAIKNNENGRELGFLGEARVNVLKLNIELDRKYPFHG